jgi:hypothetical protein
LEPFISELKVENGEFSRDTCMNEMVEKCMNLSLFCFGEQKVSDDANIVVEDNVVVDARGVGTSTR